MPVKKTVYYQFGYGHAPAEYYTGSEMAKALKINKKDLVVLLRSGQGFSYHMTERITRRVKDELKPDLEYFWRVDGIDGDSFKENIQKWEAMTDAERDAALAKAHQIAKEQKARGIKF